MKVIKIKHVPKVSGSGGIFTGTVGTVSGRSGNGVEGSLHSHSELPKGVAHAKSYKFN